LLRARQGAKTSGVQNKRPRKRDPLALARPISHGEVGFPFRQD